MLGFVSFNSLLGGVVHLPWRGFKVPL
jgi:hypothetical protein